MFLIQKYLVVWLVFLLLLFPSFALASTSQSWWDFQSIDTMKYSRDHSRQYLDDRQTLQRITEEQVSVIAEAGATHVSIATPYDEEFYPVLSEWVRAARRHNLKVWFRGNWSGWEEWFEYEPITREEHLQKTVEFIKKHPELFENGDVFSACPECENGGPGDPRHNGDAAGHRAFLIAEYRAVREAFRLIDRDVRSNFNSMNGDVARLIMDQETTKALGGLVVVDHYVRSPAQLNADITAFAERSGGKVILGEFGAPIPDIHGSMTREQQAEWVDEALQLLALNPDLAGLNYWTSYGGSTSLWGDDGMPRLAVDVLRKYFQELAYRGKITNTLGSPIREAVFEAGELKSHSDEEGNFVLRTLEPDKKVLIRAVGYTPRILDLAEISSSEAIVLDPEEPSLWYRLRVWWQGLWE